MVASFRFSNVFCFNLRCRTNIVPSYNNKNYNVATISETATNTASPLMAMRLFPNNSQ